MLNTIFARRAKVIEYVMLLGGRRALYTLIVRRHRRR